MIKIEKSDVLQKVLKSLVKVTSTKTSESHAYLTVSLLVRELEKKYDFLKYVSITTSDFEGKTKYDIYVMEDINYTKSEEIGKSIQNLIDILKSNLGKKAGYFFVREFRDAVGEDYHMMLKQIGVDLRLTELQNELFGISRSFYCSYYDSILLPSG